MESCCGRSVGDGRTVNVLCTRLFVCGELRPPPALPQSGLVEARRRSAWESGPHVQEALGMTHTSERVCVCGVCENTWINRDNKDVKRRRRRRRGVGGEKGGRETGAPWGLHRGRGAHERKRRPGAWLEVSYGRLMCSGRSRRRWSGFVAAERQAEERKRKRRRKFCWVQN